MSGRLNRAAVKECFHLDHKSPRKSFDSILSIVKWGVSREWGMKIRKPKLPALLYGGSCRGVIALRPTGESQIQNRGVENTNKDSEGNTKIVTANKLLMLHR